MTREAASGRDTADRSASDRTAASGREALVEYLLRASFDAADQGYADAQVLDSVAEGVTAGNLTVVEDDGTLAIVGKKCAFTAQDTPEWGGQGFYGGRASDGTIPRALGRGLLGKVNRDATDQASIPVAFMNTQSVDTRVASAKREYAVNLNNDALLDILLPSLSCSDIVAYVASVDYQSAIVLGGYDSNGVPWRSGQAAASYLYGATLFIEGGAFTGWTLLWKTAQGNTGTLYTAFSNYDGVGTLGNLRVPDVDLSAVLEPTDYALSPSADDTFSHIADTLLVFDVDTLPSAGQIEVEFRQETANTDCWRVTVDDGGTIDLDEVVSSSPTQRGTSAAAVSNGDRVIVIADDDDIEVYVAGAEEISYASATNFKTETDGEVETLGTGGAISNLHTNARTSSTYDTTLGGV